MPRVASTPPTTVYGRVRRTRRGPIGTSATSALADEQRGGDRVTRARRRHRLGSDHRVGQLGPGVANGNVDPRPHATWMARDRGERRRRQR